MPKLHSVIYRLLRLVLRLNAAVYGPGASREVLRDLTGEWSLTDREVNEAWRRYHA